MADNYEQNRQERRKLKQQLFAIRRHVEGEEVTLTEELSALKTKYEALSSFTNWSDFPDKWDIGDPHGVKQSAYAFNDVDRRNYRRINGKSYETIVHLETPDGTNEGEEDALTKDETVIKNLAETAN